MSSSIDFEDTYDGLGDQLDEANDDLNDDTFGGGIAAEVPEPVGKDFDFFGKTAQVSNVIEEEQLRYNLNRARTSTTQPSASFSQQKPRRTGYEKYQDPGYIPEIEAKSNVWGTTSQSKVPPNDLVAGTGLESRPKAASRKMMSLEEVEAAMRAQSLQSQPQSTAIQSQIPQRPARTQASQAPPRPPGSHAQGTAPESLQPSGAPGIVSGSGISDGITQHKESLTKSSRLGQPQTVYRSSDVSRRSSASIPVITHPEQLLQLSEEQRKRYLEEDAKRAKRNHKIFLLSRGNGLMTPQDKNFITRVQLQQLVAATGNTNDPDPETALVEDFYYQVYSQIRGAPRQHPTQPLGHFAQTYLFQTGGRRGGPQGRRQQVNGDNHMQRMQQQVQRAVEATKLKPKNNQLILEGSLGKISFSNAKTPRPLLNIKRNEKSDAPRPQSSRDASAVSPSDRKSIMRNIESVYTALMRLEDLERQTPPPPTDDPESVTRHMEWNEQMKHLNNTLWNDLKVLEPIVPGSTVTHPFIAFLSFGKGKKAIRRIFRHIDQEQRLTILTMIVVHLDQLDVIAQAQIAPGDTQPPPVVREDIELFSQVVMPSLLGFVTETGMNVIIGLMGIVLEQTNVIRVSRTKIGLGILTMFLSRAELVKQSGQVDKGDWKSWTESYDRLFNILEPTLGDIFPGPVNTGDDVYIWQFLAAMGVGASPDQQQRLVIAVKCVATLFLPFSLLTSIVRDRVMETVTQSKTLPPDMASQRLGNVNLFMRAIGLDVELLG